MNKSFDDGNWNWEYSCKYVNPSNDPNDWYYYIAFETDDGGYLSGNEISCNYYNTKNSLEICHHNTKIKFYVENFQDISVILKPMIKAHKATIYPVFESNNSIRTKN